MSVKEFEGVVTEYFSQEGYGFVTTTNISSQRKRTDVFFHISDLEESSVSEGDRLRFSARKTDDGFEARKPVVIEKGGEESNKGSKTRGTIQANESDTKNGTVGQGCKGTVTKYFEEDGYGFVTTSDITSKRNMDEFHTEDVFFHISDLETHTVSKGDRLKFNAVETDDGLQAKQPTVTGRKDNVDGDISKADPAEQLGVSGEKDDTKYGRDSPKTSGDIESFQDENKFR